MKNNNIKRFYNISTKPIYFNLTFFIIKIEYIFYYIK